MNNVFISSAKKDEVVENFVKSKREELEKMIPGFVDDRKFTDIVLNFYERGIKDGIQMMKDRKDGGLTKKTIEVKILHLPQKAKWYIMQESGEKPEEYREITPYWCKRLLTKVLNLEYFGCYGLLVFI